MTYNIVILAEQEQIIKAQHGDNLFHVLSKAGYMLANSCGGNGTCGKCLVNIKAKEPIPLSSTEENLLREKRAKNGQRLACFIEVTQDMQVKIDDEKDTKAQILIGSIEEFEKIDSGIKIKVLPKVKDKINSIYGIAVDIGTTTIAAYLMDLQSGQEIDVYSSLNPQKVYGADVITRISYTTQNENGLKELQEMIVDELNGMVDVFAHRNAIDKNLIYEMVIVGNPTMLHLLWGVDCKNIANAPFVPSFSEQVSVKAKEIGIGIKQEGYVITLPLVSAYVGADTLSAVMAANMYQDEEINLLIDIGTNGEIVLGNKEKMVCCSTAAGPAFEGGSITCGVGGILGAIDHVNFQWKRLFSTIGDKEAVGICGSGLLDCAAELLQYSMVDKSGKMLAEAELPNTLPKNLSQRVVNHEGKIAYILDEKRNIFLTQSDIRELQLAKAAIYAGIEVLIDEMGITAEKIKNVYLAGGFGNYLDMNSAFYIKLIPEELKGKVIPLGNAAGTGAKMALLSGDILTNISKVKLKIRYIELSTSMKFQDKFIKAISF